MRTCCPICGKEMVSDPDGDQKSYRPFCSERCRWIDLGHWLDGQYCLEVEYESESRPEPSNDASESESNSLDYPREL